MIDYSEELLLR